MKPNGQAKTKQRQKKMIFLLANHQSIFVLEKHSSAYRPEIGEGNQSVVLFCNADKKVLYSYICLLCTAHFKKL